MKILILSDTHGRYEDFEKLLLRTANVDLMIHCGDVCGDEERMVSAVSCGLIMIAGNNDFFTTLPKEQILELCGHRLLLVHGHRQEVYFGLENLYWRALRENCDIVFYGHTHVPQITEEKGIWFVNPGSLSLPRQRNHRKTYVLLDLPENGEPVFTLKEL